MISVVCPVVYTKGLSCTAFKLGQHRVLGAPQESGGSCGPLFGSPFPKVLKATTKLRTTESDDGVGAAHSPMHSGTFEACADGDLASGLHHASGSAQALGVELRVAHAFSIGLEIMEAAAGLLRTRYLAPDRGD